MRGARGSEVALARAGLVETPLGLLLVALVISGIRRMRYLRRDLSTLRELRSELEPER